MEVCRLEDQRRPAMLLATLCECTCGIAAARDQSNRVPEMRSEAVDAMILLNSSMVAGFTAA